MAIFAKRDLNYIAGILLIFVFIGMLITGLIQLKFELHRFIYHIYGAYLLIILACVHVFTNWKKLSGFIKKKIRLKKEYIISIALIFSVIFTFVTGLLQVKLNLPRSRFIYHIYGAYITLILALVHIYFNLSKVKTYLIQRKKLAGMLGGVLIIAVSVLGIKLFAVERKAAYRKTLPMEFDMVLEYHEKTKHTYAELMGRVSVLKYDNDFEKISSVKKKTIEKLPEGLTIAELLHESGKLNSFPELKAIEISYKSYPQSKKIYLAKEFSKQGLEIDDAIRKRRSARDYSKSPISQTELSRLLYYAYGRIKDNLSERAVWSMEGTYPIEIYVVINNVEGIARGVYHYNVLEHSLELLKEGDYRFRIARASLGQELVGNANVAIIKTAVFERVKYYGNRGYRYVHLDAGAIGENIYLEAISMGLGVCGIGAFFDDQINEMLDLDGLREMVIYVTSIGRV